MRQISIRIIMNLPQYMYICLQWSLVLLPAAARNKAKIIRLICASLVDSIYATVL